MKIAYFLLLLVFITVPAAGFTDMQQDYGKPKELADLPGMSAEGTKYMLGVHEADGVKGVAYLNDVRNKMAKYGLKQTHHIMVEFKDVASGEVIETGSVTVKAEDPDKNIRDEIQLYVMEGSFGADIYLVKKGMYNFIIGAVLSDGKKRTFRLHFEYK